MKMNFSKDELAMVYQYAAGTKEETLAGLKEIVPVIRDRQTRLWRVPSESWTPSRSRSAAVLLLTRSSVLSRSGTIPSGAAGEGGKATSQEKRARPGTVIIASRAAARGLPL